MCSNYRPVTRLDRLLTFFEVERERDEPPPDIWPVGMAPFIRLVDTAAGPQRIAHDGLFGLLPHFATEVSYGRKTYNARSETVHQLPSFRESWAKGWRCIVPAEAIFEPNWESGRCERWMVFQEGHVPLGIAGIYRAWRGPDGREVFSFAMLTVNADAHPLMKRFHKPGDEKRMVVVLDPADYAVWLSGSVAEATALLRPWGGPLLAEPAPLPVRPPPPFSTRIVRGRPAGGEGQEPLF